MPALQGNTSTYSVTNNATPIAVVANVDTAEIQIGEDASVASYPTTAFEVRIPATNSTGIRIAKGTSYIFSKGHRNGGARGIYRKGEIAGYIRITDTASTTFQQIEPGVQGGN